jgi:hypothetical protein
MKTKSSWKVIEKMYQEDSEGYKEKKEEKKETKKKMKEQSKERGMEKKDGENKHNHHSHTYPPPLQTF